MEFCHHLKHPKNQLPAHLRSKFSARQCLRYYTTTTSWTTKVRWRDIPTYSFSVHTKNTFWPRWKWISETLPGFTNIFSFVEPIKELQNLLAVLVCKFNRIYTYSLEQGSITWISSQVCKDKKLCKEQQIQRNAGNNNQHLEMRECNWRSLQI